VGAAAFLLERSWSTFPAGTVHLAVVDPGVGTERAALLVEARGHVFVAPDNGLLAPLIDSEPLVVVRRAGPSAPVRGPSTTFDGRDRFAPLVARLVEGDPAAAFGEPCAGAGAYQGLAVPAPKRLANGSIAAEVVHVDRFGNLITSVPFIWLAEAGADWRERWSCEVGGRRLALVRTYSDAPARTPVALVNSYDRMEVALARGDAARELALGRGAEVRFVPRAAEVRSAAVAAGKRARPRAGPKASAPPALPARGAQRKGKKGRKA
jgi:S-adenosylmethionine hydrolase